MVLTATEAVNSVVAVPVGVGDGDNCDCRGGTAPTAALSSSLLSGADGVDVAVPGTFEGVVDRWESFLDVEDGIDDDDDLLLLIFPPGPRFDDGDDENGRLVVADADLAAAAAARRPSSFSADTFSSTAFNFESLASLEYCSNCVWSSCRRIWNEDHDDAGGGSLRLPFIASPPPPPTSKSLPPFLEITTITTVSRRVIMALKGTKLLFVFLITPLLLSSVSTSALSSSAVIPSLVCCSLMKTVVGLDTAVWDGDLVSVVPVPVVDIVSNGLNVVQYD